MAAEAIILFFSLSLLLCDSWGALQVGFYASTCPSAESIVASTVQSSVNADKTIAASLLRLHFHDCFVQGCDGSILIDGPTAEKRSGPHAGVRGYELIEGVKSQLEQMCPGVVSCSDIVAMAARDAIALSGGPRYDVETGRRDGRVSAISDASIMPDVDDSIDVLKSKFASKGLSAADLVLLSGGGHTIGTTACFFMTKRLYSFTPDGGPDPSIEPSFLPELQATCPQNGDVNVRLAIDRGSQTAFDESILNNIRSGFAVLASDAQLYQDQTTQSVVDSYVDSFGSGFGPSFNQDFADAMVRLGRLGVKTGGEGEIRRVCAQFN
ncbi:peroxidase 43 [Nymphaea colorata]|nr:peroxidase 43 [Nymphaea colorata]